MTLLILTISTSGEGEGPAGPQGPEGPQGPPGADGDGGGAVADDPGVTRLYLGTAPPLSSGSYPKAVALDDRYALRVGGTGSLLAVEKYDRASDAWSALPNLGSGNRDSLMCLQGGTVYRFGGGADGSTPTLHTSVDGGTSWTAQTAPSAYFTAGDAVALEDGRIFLMDHNGGTVFDPGAGTYTAVAGLPSGVDHIRSCRLADGTVLIAGGVYSASCYLFDPGTGSVTATGALPQATWEAALHPLTDGGAVLLGGYPDNGVIYRYRNGTWSVPTARLPIARQNPGCASFADGTVLLIGGGPSQGTASLLAF